MELTSPNEWDLVDDGAHGTFDLYLSYADFAALRVVISERQISADPLYLLEEVVRLVEFD